MWIDTHTHLYSSAFDEDREEAIKRAKSAGVEQVFLPSIDQSHFKAMEAMEHADPDWVKLMIGLHPCSVKADNATELAFVEQQLKTRPFAAIGEVGMDLYWDKTHKAEQEAVFRQHCEWALAYNLPLIIHVRDAFEPLFEQLEAYRNKGLKGIFHCFSGGKNELDWIFNFGFLIGLGGVLTFKNGGLDKLFANENQSVLNHIVLETDAPYLAPHPHRGKRNETAYLTLVGEKLASIFQVSDEELAKITSRNAQKLFKTYSHADTI
ncbi:MAG: TatD family hydrolase [Flavobacteriales bacterium]